MKPVLKYRGRAIRLIAILSIAAFAAILLSMVPYPEHLVQVGPLLLTLSYIIYASMWRPYVEVSDSGVRLRNVFQVVHIPWSTIQKVSAKWSLTITSAAGEHSAWSLPATPGGHAPRLAGADAARSDAAAVGRVIEDRRQELFDAGYLCSPAARRLESTAEIDKPTVTIVTVGLAISAVEVFFG